MINKKYMSYIKKELKKNKELTICYFATEEEKEYLKKFNINTKVVVKKRKGLISDYEYDIEYCTYYLDK